MKKANFQLPLISYQQHQNTENEKFENEKFGLQNSKNLKAENFFRLAALVLFIISGLLLVISLSLGTSSGLEKSKMPEIQFPKMCQFRKCNDIGKFSDNISKFNKHSFNIINEPTQ